MPALIPLALTLAPQLAAWLFGAKGEQVTAQVSAVAQAVTGTPYADAQVAALADPAKAQAFTLELHRLAAQMQAEQHAAELAELQALLADTASARGQTLSLVEAHSLMAWGAPVVSVVVMVTFGLMLAMVLSHQLPPGSEALANVMLGSLAGMATSVAAYWVGSSSSSRSKDGVIQEQSRALATSVPLAATTPSVGK